MLGLVDNLARRIVRRGFRRGLIEGSSIWLVAGALAWLVRIVVRPEAPKMTREDLRVGESIIVTHLPAPPPPTAPAPPSAAPGSRRRSHERYRLERHRSVSPASQSARSGRGVLS